MTIKVNDTTIISEVRGVSSAIGEDDAVAFNSLVKEEYG